LITITGPPKKHTYTHEKQFAPKTKTIIEKKKGQKEEQQGTDYPRVRKKRDLTPTSQKPILAQAQDRLHLSLIEGVGRPRILSQKPLSG
jgi:hypothetical protein